MGGKDYPVARQDSSRESSLSFWGCSVNGADSVVHHCLHVVLLLAAMATTAFLVVVFMVSEGGGEGKGQRRGGEGSLNIF